MMAEVLECRAMLSINEDDGRVLFEAVGELDDARPFIAIWIVGESNFMEVELADADTPEAITAARMYVIEIGDEQREAAPHALSTTEGTVSMVVWLVQRIEEWGEGVE